MLRQIYSLRNIRFVLMSRRLRTNLKAYITTIAKRLWFEKKQHHQKELLQAPNLLIQQATQRPISDDLATFDLLIQAEVVQAVDAERTLVESHIEGAETAKGSTFDFSPSKSIGSRADRTDDGALGRFADSPGHRYGNPIG